MVKAAPIWQPGNGWVREGELERVIEARFDEVTGFAMPMRPKGGALESLRSMFTETSSDFLVTSARISQGFSAAGDASDLEYRADPSRNLRSAP